MTGKRRTGQGLVSHASRESGSSRADPRARRWPTLECLRPQAQRALLLGCGAHAHAMRGRTSLCIRMHEREKPLGAAKTTHEGTCVDSKARTSGQHGHGLEANRLSWAHRRGEVHIVEPDEDRLGTQKLCRAHERGLDEPLGHAARKECAVMVELRRYHQAMRHERTMCHKTPSFLGYRPLASMGMQRRNGPQASLAPRQSVPLPRLEDSARAPPSDALICGRLGNHKQYVRRDACGAPSACRAVGSCAMGWRRCGSKHTARTRCLRLADRHDKADGPKRKGRG